MSSKGPKMVGGRYGSAWNGRKTPKSYNPMWRSQPPSPARSGRVQLQLAGKFYLQDRLALLLFSLAGACARVVAGDASHDQNPFGVQMGQNDPVRCSRFLGVFSKALELKMSVLGLGFSLARKTMFI